MTAPEHLVPTRCHAEHPTERNRFCDRPFGHTGRHAVDTHFDRRIAWEAALTPRSPVEADAPEEATHSITSIRIALSLFRKSILALRNDVEIAASECLVPLPEPGTDLARVLIANRLIAGQRDAEHTARLAAEQESARLRADAERYRFLRDNGLGKALRARYGFMELHFGYDSDGVTMKTGLVGGSPDVLIDTAIDVARRTPTPETGA